MAKGKAHNEAMKAAVMAALLAGQGVSEVAAQYNLDHSVVSRWKSRMPVDQLHQLARKKGEILEQLLFEYLQSSLTTLRAQVEIAGEPDYIRKQRAERLAVLHGVLADKSIRLLEAVERASLHTIAADRAADPAYVH